MSGTRFKLIPLDQKEGVAIIDASDFAKVSKYKWHLSDTGYAVWRGLVNGTRKTVRMHRLIADTPEGLVTDHINRNRLDNRKHNLRIVTQRENLQNRDHGKGYWYQKQNKNWVVEINGKHIGAFDSEELANQIATMIFAGELPLDRISLKKLCKNGHDKELVGTYGNNACRVCVLNNQKDYYRRKYHAEH